jgi:hypothetical protein
MIIAKNSERIFLQPIDQLYANQKTKDSSESEDQIKFFDEYTHGVMDYLNISTDSETKYDSVDEDLEDLRVEDCLVDDWKNKLDYYKTYQLCVMRSFVIQRVNFLRNTLNLSNQPGSGRTQSCHTIMTQSNWQAVNPFVCSKNMEIERDMGTPVHYDDKDGDVDCCPNFLKNELDN